MRGDLALYCYPEKMLAEIRWHGTGDFPAKYLHVKGIAPIEFEVESFHAKTARSYCFPVMGEEAPLADDAFKLLT